MQATITAEIRKKLGASRAQVSHLIMHELRIRGWTQKSLALNIGVSAAAVSHVINGIGHSGKILKRLSEIGVPEEILFIPKQRQQTSAVFDPRDFKDNEVFHEQK